MKPDPDELNGTCNLPAGRRVRGFPGASSAIGLEHSDSRRLMARQAAGQAFRFEQLITLAV